MPTSAIYVDPSVTTANAIQIDGVTYLQAGATSASPDTFSIDVECSDCDPNACGPAPCANPGDLAGTYTVTFTINAVQYIATCTGSYSAGWNQTAMTGGGPYNGVIFVSIGAKTSMPCGWTVTFTINLTGSTTTTNFVGQSPAGSYGNCPSPDNPVYSNYIITSISVG